MSFEQENTEYEEYEDILCCITVNETNDYGKNSYRIYANGTFKNLKWASQKVFQWKIENGSFFYRNNQNNPWRCDCHSSDEEFKTHEDRLIVEAIEVELAIRNLLD